MADQALEAAPVKSKPDYTRLSQTDVGVLLKLHRDGLTQVQIAQRLGCSQKTVSKWLTDLTDSAETAKVYLRGKALQMAENVVKRGMARDHVATLKGIGVLADDSANQGVIYQIGIKDSDVTFAPLNNAVSAPLHRLTAETGSDN